MQARPGVRCLYLCTVAVIGAALPLTAQEAAAQETAAQETAQDAVSLGTIFLEGAGGIGASSADVTRTAKTALKSPAPLATTPQAVTLISRKTMDDQAVSSVAQALTYSVNTNGQRYGTDPRSDYFSVRGFPSDLFLDGLRVPQIGNQTGGYAGVMVEPFMIESIEVLRGPASALFGQSNVGGIVSMNAKKPQSTAGGELYLRFGSYNRKEIGLDFTGPVSEGSDWSYRVISVLRDSDNMVAFSRNDRIAFAPSLTWRPSDATRVTFSASYLKDDIGQPGAIVPAEGSIFPNAHGQLLPVDVSDGDPRQAVYKKTTQMIGYELEHDLSPDLTLSHSMRYTRMRLDYRSLFSGPLQADGQTVNRYNYLAQPDLKAFITDAHLTWRPQTGAVDHEVIAGVDFQRQELVNLTSSTAGPGLNLYDPDYTVALTPAVPTRSLTQTNYQRGIYLQDTLRWQDLTVVGGLRYDSYTTASTQTELLAGTSADYLQSGEQLTGRIGASWAFENGIAPYILYSTSFLPALTLADTPLKPTKGELKEIGIKYAPSDRPWMIGLSYFEANQTNVVKRIAGAFYQTDEVTVKGWELEAKLDIGRQWHVNAAASYQDPKVSHSENAAEIGKLPYTVPKKQASLYVSYDVDTPMISGDLSMGLGVRYVGETAGDTLNTFMVPSYTVSDAFVSYAFDDYRLQLNAYNLGNKRYVAGCNVASQCYFGGERTFTATLSKTF
ncbi:TonB-dependent siderophore receptor [Pseudogemmobacter hezensis]|uniref:TonB-dependent siderophore receptor n=1 Tax=Pseudogemmobacter hezensis TaxID=2737662 RepID=UPI001C130F09|nr:TonB-dependent siderophore receptor [Pseudogemmobacter hezensis]